MKEKRKYTRIKPTKPVTAKYSIVSYEELGRTVKRGEVYPKDMSVSGMFIELPFMKPKFVKDLLAGTNKIALELDAPGHKSKIKITGRAVWIDKKEGLGCKSHAIGLRFDGMNEKERDRLVRFMLELILH